MSGPDDFFVMSRKYAQNGLYMVIKTTGSNQTEAIKATGGFERAKNILKT